MVDAMEMRGCKLLLFQRIRDTLLIKGKDSWTIAQVSALLVGNHEILKDENRFNAIPDVDCPLTLTFYKRCSLVDVLQKSHRAHNNQTKHPELNVHYEDVVGVKANVFLSFAYDSSYLDLVDALECFFEQFPGKSPENTYFWFDMFVNNQWAANTKTFEWWSTTFRLAIQDIGLTAIMLYPWDNPLYFTRAWCLYELYCSAQGNIAILFSRKQVTSFKNALKKDPNIIISSLCDINLGQATTRIEEEKEKIFLAVRTFPGGIHRFNMDMTNLIRAEFSRLALELINTGDGVTDLDKIKELEEVAYFLCEQGSLGEEEVILNRFINKSKTEKEFIQKSQEENKLSCLSFCCRATLLFLYSSLIVLLVISNVALLIVSIGIVVLYFPITNFLQFCFYKFKKRKLFSILVFIIFVVLFDLNESKANVNSFHDSIIFYRSIKEPTVVTLTIFSTISISLFNFFYFTAICSKGSEHFEQIKTLNVRDTAFVYGTIFACGLILTFLLPINFFSKFQDFFENICFILVDYTEIFLLHIFQNAAYLMVFSFYFALILGFSLNWSSQEENFKFENVFVRFIKMPHASVLLNKNLSLLKYAERLYYRLLIVDSKERQAMTNFRLGILYQRMSDLNDIHCFHCQSKSISRRVECAYMRKLYLDDKALEVLGKAIETEYWKSWSFQNKVDLAYSAFLLKSHNNFAQLQKSLVEIVRLLIGSGSYLDLSIEYLLKLEELWRLVGDSQEESPYQTRIDDLIKNKVDSDLYSSNDFDELPINILERMASLCSKNGSLQEACALYERIVVWRKYNLGLIHESTKQSEIELVKIQRKLKIDVKYRGGVSLGHLFRSCFFIIAIFWFTIAVSLKDRMWKNYCLNEFGLVPKTLRYIADKLSGNMDIRRIEIFAFTNVSTIQWRLETYAPTEILSDSLSNVFWRKILMNSLGNSQCPVDSYITASFDSRYSFYHVMLADSTRKYIITELTTCSPSLLAHQRQTESHLNDYNSLKGLKETLFEEDKLRKYLDSSRRYFVKANIGFCNSIEWIDHKLNDAAGRLIHDISHENYNFLPQSKTLALIYSSAGDVGDEHFNINIHELKILFSVLFMLFKIFLVYHVNCLIHSLMSHFERRPGRTLSFWDYLYLFIEYGIVVYGVVLFAVNFLLISLYNLPIMLIVVALSVYAHEHFQIRRCPCDFMLGFVRFICTVTKSGEEFTADNNRAYELTNDTEFHEVLEVLSARKNFVGVALRYSKMYLNPLCLIFLLFLYYLFFDQDTLNMVSEQLNIITRKMAYGR